MIREHAGLLLYAALLYALAIKRAWVGPHKLYGRFLAAVLVSPLFAVLLGGSHHIVKVISSWTLFAGALLTGLLAFSIAVRTSRRLVAKAFRHLCTLIRRSRGERHDAPSASVKIEAT